MKNVLPKYQDLSVEEIKIINQQNSLPYAVFMCQIEGDFNFATLIRNASAFGAREVFYYAPRKHYDRRGTVGQHHYVDVNFLHTYEEVIALKNRYYFVGLDNNRQDTKQMRDYKWRENTLMIFGEERTGISPCMLELCEEVVEIKQLGVVPSINVGSASAVAMVDFINKWRTYET